MRMLSIPISGSVQVVSKVRPKAHFNPISTESNGYILNARKLEILLTLFLPFPIASSDIILDLACKLKKPNVALVHQMPFVTDQTGFAATLEKVINVYLHKLLGINCDPP